MKKIYTIMALCCLLSGFWLFYRSEDVRAEQQNREQEQNPQEQQTERGPGYAAYFTKAALRLDLIHHGGLETEESFGLERLVREPRWPGRRTSLVDPTGYGDYRYQVFDAQSERLIFSQGYSTLFGEWLTTEEATKRTRSMHESVRFPYPLRPVKVVIEGRDDNGRMQELYSIEIDPNHHSIHWERTYDFPVLDIEINGEPTTTLDILFLGDGYTAEEMPKFRSDVRRFSEAFFEYEPFIQLREQISIRAIEAVSRESGTDEPRKGFWRDTLFDSTFNTFDTARYLTIENDRTIREVASLAPYDTIVVLVNTSRYGGGGIFNSYSILAADTEYAEYILIHEFGHGFAGLGDEYHRTGSTAYDEELFYPPGIEPYEANITANLNRNTIKWGDLIEADTPIPTPPTEQYANKIGAFEGAGYQTKGLFRPCYDSIMFHKGHLDYCPVSERAVAQLIRWTADGGWQ